MQTTAAIFDFDRDAPLAMRVVGERSADGIKRRLFSYLTPHGVRRAGMLIQPEGEGPHPGILYLHWYESESGSSNWRQFQDEAGEMAKRGAACLLVETLWSDRDWFIKRTHAQDYEDTLAEVAATRRALDLLAAEPGIDAAQLAVVGHDFGGMFGSLAGGADGRPAAYVIMAATPRFPDWYLYYPRLEEDARERFVDEMRPLDPVEHIGALAPATILFQFATDDPHVPRERAEAFYAAAGDPKVLRWYEAGHELNEDAARDRQAWLVEQVIR